MGNNSRNKYYYKKLLLLIIFFLFSYNSLFFLSAQEIEYPSIERLLNSNFKTMTIDKFINIAKNQGLTSVNGWNRGSITSVAYEGIIDSLELKLNGTFMDNEPIIDGILIYIKRPNTPVNRFYLFEKLSDYITVLYGDPVISLFRSASSFLINKNNNNIIHSGFRDYTSAKNYKELIIQSESSLISNSYGNYYNKWSWNKQKNGFKDRVPGMNEGSAKIELDIEYIIITFSSR